MLQLRDHPGLRYHGIPSWPPVWIRNDEQRVCKIRGEVGTLEYVFANERISDKLFLVMRHGGERYVGCLIFSERLVCQHFAHILRLHTGKPIKEIGDLDVSQML